MPQVKKNNIYRRSSASKKGSKSGGSFSNKKRRKFPWWSFLLGMVLFLSSFCFIFFYYFVNPLSFTLKSSVNKVYFPPGYTIRGIDISHYQGVVDWELLRNASMDSDPVSFVIVKATEGETIIDECFNDNFYQARKNGVVRGAYHFLVPNVSAKKQAIFFLRQAHLEEGDLPPVLDVEDETRWLAAGKDKRQIQKMALEWLDIVEKHYQVTPIIYSSYKFRQDVLSDKKFDRYPFWMAHYFVDTTAKDVQWSFWQHTDQGKISGIVGYVDCNVFGGTLEEFNSLLIPPLSD